jgi:hypothetical protein
MCLGSAVCHLRCLMVGSPERKGLDSFLRKRELHAEPNALHRDSHYDIRMHVKPPASRGPPLVGQFRVAGPDSMYCAPPGQVSLQDDPAWMSAQAVASTLGWTLVTVHVGGAAGMGRSEGLIWHVYWHFSGQKVAAGPLPSVTIIDTRSVHIAD